MPEIAPEGPVLIVVGIAEQRAWVYRNGVRIGIAAVSTGNSNLYDDAPMPFMQRLTWGGVALHAGQVPGYPASHGCVRLPRTFAEQLFAITERGMTVVIVQTFSAPVIVSPGLFPPEAGPAGPVAAPRVGAHTWRWRPELAPDGPLTLVLSSRDREIVVLRNAVEIGRAGVDIDAAILPGSRAYLLLAGSGSGASALLPDRPALRWLEVPLDATVAAPGDDLRQLVADGRLRVPPGFARLVYDALVPGTTVVVTDDPLRPAAGPDLPVLQGDALSAPVDGSPAPPRTPDP